MIIFATRMQMVSWCLSQEKKRNSLEEDVITITNVVIACDVDARKGRLKDPTVSFQSDKELFIW